MSGEVDELDRKLDECLNELEELKRKRVFVMTPERYGLLFRCLEVALRKLKKAS